MKRRISTMRKEKLLQQSSTTSTGQKKKRVLYANDDKSQGISGMHIDR
jgi:hypothetical protein